MEGTLPTLLGQDASQSPEAIRGERAGAGELTSPGVLAPESTDVSRWPRGLPTRHAGVVLTVRPLYQLIKLTF